MFFNKEKPHFGGRSLENVKLTEIVITRNWEYIIDQFKAKNELTTAGLAASCTGFQYYNFFWARGAYIRQLVTPVLTRNRYYYERWLGMLDPLKVNSKAATTPVEEFKSMWQGTRGVAPKHTGVSINTPTRLSLCVDNPHTALDNCFEHPHMLSWCVTNRFKYSDR